MSKFNFGEYDGRQEYLRGEDYFLNSFMLPPNFNTSNISNNKKFIIVGHKGVGKSSVQLYMERLRREEGYLTDFLSFYDDLSPNDYLEFSKTQRISFVEVANAADATALYDFREVWVRIILKKIAELLDRDFPSSFTRLMNRSHSGSKSLVDGIAAGLRIKGDFKLIFGDIGIDYDFSKLSDAGVMPLSDFNELALKLLLESHAGAMIFYSIDELVVSNFETKSDEFKVRMAIIRDVIKSSNKLNNFFVKNGMDINVVCSLRPEVRDILYNLDSDISKFLDSCYTSVDWNAVEDMHHPLVEVLFRKVQFGSPTEMSREHVEAMFVGSMDFTKERVPIPLFLLRQSWHRPRDVVRFLKCYAEKNGGDESFNEDGVKKMLDDYSRISARECFDEISVKYSQETTMKIRNLIRKNYFSTYDEFISAFSVLENKIDLEELANDLFNAGVIYNVDRVDNKNRYFAAHRGVDRLFKDMGIFVHQGLWHYFAIRHRS
ncbi:ATP-binding protein [Rhizobium sp. S96]|uniref:ATP-binding protein n=1 Tax=Rhizobium sp. S96 TaxID=3055140 RepID=UPI0025AA7DA2|nr:ATP-binding protein [Rhizobium sp. S96]MDM9618836.1 ATP-binding protein [Rhizobium sp. S96]